MFVRQIFDEDTYTYTYLVADTDSKEAMLIDPVLAHVDRDLALLEQLGFKLVYAADTHVHADHITGAGELRRRTGAKMVGSIHGADTNDVKVDHGETLPLGALAVEVIGTPGHTDDSLSFKLGDEVFSGDALFVRGTGRTDFQAGNAGELYDVIHERLFSLPDHTRIWPGHDYRGHTVSTVGEEKRFNPRLAGKSREEFVALMGRLNLPRPKYIDLAVPANKEGGLGMAVEDTEGAFSEVGAADASKQLDEVRVIDVREPHEFTGELGHIPGAVNVPMGEISQAAVDWRRDTPLLMVCRSGRRSRQVCATLSARGYHNIRNLQGGMLEYREVGNSVAGG